MFQMTIRSPNGTLIIQGESREGEDWKATLVRLYQDANPGKPKYRLDTAGFFKAEKWTGVRSFGLIPESDGTRDDVVGVTVETDPPQF